MKKKFKILSLMTMLVFLFTNVKVFAVTIGTVDQGAYLNYHSLVDGLVKPVGHERYYGEDGEVCYCLTVGAESPNGQDYMEKMPTDPGIETILYWGYPARDGSRWGLDADEYRYATQLAIWSYEREAGINRGIDRNRLQNGPSPLSKFKPAIDFLVSKGISKEVPKFFEVTPTNVNTTVNGNYFVSEPITLQSDYTVKNIKVSILSTSDPSIKDQIKIIDADGDERTTYSSNESFRVEIPNTANTGNLRLKASGDVDIPVSLTYKSPSAGMQDMSVTPLKTTPMNRDGITINWTALKGQLEVTKKDNDGKLLDGAKFQLKDSTGKVIATQTSKDGKVNFNDLVAGNYTLEEVAAPEGYVPVGPTTVTINPNQTTKINLVDNKIQGKIAVQKTDVESGAKLQGAQFTVYDADGTSVATLTTNENGYAESGALNFGKYTMKETKAPVGYLLNDKVFDVNISENNKTYTIDATDQIIKGKVQILKEDEETKEPLEGAEFQILKDGNVVETVTSGKDGLATSGLLPFGEYVIKEIKAPNKYTLNNKEYPVTISQNMEIVKVTAENRIIKGKVSVKKTDSEVKDLNVAGAEFTIYDSKNNPVQTITTNEDGVATSGLLNYGNYTMKETKVANGYIPTDKVWNIEITEDGKTYTYDITNDIIKGKIQIVKVDSENEEKPVQGAEFDIVAKNVIGVKEGTVVDHVVTNADGFAYSKDLRFGDYTFKEVKTPQGYWKSNAEYNMSITENGKTYVRYVKNSPIQAKLRVVKTDSSNNKPLKGIKFQVRNIDNNKIVTFKNFVGIIPIPTQTLTTDENGELITPQILPYGHYQLEEVEALPGYVTMKPIKFTVDENANLQDIKDLGTVLTVNAKNDRLTSNMEIVKIDGETKKPLAGVEFKVTALDGFMKGQTWNLKSDENGKINLKNLQYGHYQIQEIKTLWNYVLNDKPVNFEVKENGKNIKLEMTNKKIRGTVEVYKVDKDTNRPLEGVEFELFNGENKIGTYTTDKDGKIVVKNLEAGSYTWKEVKAADHYDKNEDDFKFNIYQDGQVEKITVNNKVKTGDFEFTKTDVTTGKVIDGAKVEITGLDVQNQHIKIEFTSSKDGNKFTLPEGKYQFKETVAPNGYKLNEEIGNFEIKNGEVVKANLKDERKQGTLEFTKTDVTTGKTINGAKIKIECTEGLSKGKVIEFVSSENGNKFTLDEGKYTFEETVAPEGYKLSTEKGSFEIKDGKITKANLKDERKVGTLEFTKTDLTTGDVIDGAKIKITGTSGLNKGKVIEFTSSKDGNKFTLEEGTYEFEETTAPEGYKVNTEKGTFTIKDGQVTKANLKDARKMGKLEFTKTDVTTSTPLEGAKVEITCTSGLDKGKTISFTSSKEGNKFDLSEGEYEFKEITAPNGYNVNKEVGKFTIKDGQVTKAELKDERTSGKLIFKKTDVATGETIEGAKIKIECTEGLDKGKVIEFTSSKEGNEFTLLAGKYTFSEEAAPKGYEKTSEIGTFEITKQGEVVKCNLKNKKFEIKKTGSEFDMNNLIPVGVLVVALGASAVFITRRKKRA
ncbi:SpaA isopeptide-forming pilin-related protein (plasmid) [Clostridium perfringens]|uniref:SpaA isopeptide-forming pilin-related protein n=2 Tax=Clostridium perfringens TaxID=1502 RepID=UPI001C866655|nr:SpaA isopeptide-forming pilin-related protein [Clostridium perfringens]MDK0575128.1 SpaA isopeptide-forming pilin-related protein [Clostridium perfringens]MDK0834798.1 SpaA isopeptide-forming pilin-related protein [Clostridium perfringens]WDT41129.1 SpaA isopeptide-forming pilin-related protein [Clostridium perfringens]